MSGRKRSLVFLIRLWPAENGGEPDWRASVESVGSGERRAFASLDDLLDFLKQQIVQAYLPNPDVTKRADD